MQDTYQVLVDDYVNSYTPLRVLLAQPKFKGDRFIAILHSLSKSSIMDDKKSMSKIFSDAEEFDRHDFTQQTKIIFFNNWCMFSNLHGLKRQAEIILEKLKRLNTSGVPSILLSEIEMTNAYVTGSKEAYFECLINEYKKYEKTSPRYKLHLDNYVRMKCFGCMGDSISDNIIEKYKDKISPVMDIYFYKFINDLGTCNLKSIQSYFQKIDLNCVEIGPLLPLYDLLLKKDIRARNKDSPTHQDDIDSSINANFFLMNGNIDSAAAEVQKVKSGLLDHIAYSFLKYTAIRVELCKKNMEAAYQLLKGKINASEKHFMDDFFLARVELLRGNREKAFQYFYKAYQQCEQYSALNRIQVELDMALEIKPSELFFLTQNLFQNTNKNIGNINYDEILNSEKLVGVNRLIGESEALKKIKTNILAYSVTNLPLLITGETGVGKDIVARALHEESPRNTEPFLAINCGAITESLLQSELFGHLAGSYTGAISENKGVFIEAGKGTVFLDEIGEISAAIQVALLRVLENNEVRPVGGSHQIAFQCRIIAATNANLELLVAKKIFREDLYYRLKRLEIKIPPLRERKRDIIPIVNHFLKSFRHSFEAPLLSADLQEALREFDWPGNIRQLKNEIEKMDLLQSRKACYELSDCEFLTGTNKVTEKISAIVKTENQIEDFRDETLTAWRRLEKIKSFFDQFKDLTRKEIARKMNISLATATTDLKKLVAEGYIIKVEPSASTRSYYFKLNTNKLLGIREQGTDNR